MTDMKIKILKAALRLNVEWVLACGEYRVTRLSVDATHQEQYATKKIRTQIKQRHRDWQLGHVKPKVSAVVKKKKCG